MKKYVVEFIRRGMMACGIGPLVLVVFYLVLRHQCAVLTLNISEVCMGIVSLTVLAFIAGGMNMIYQIERLPLMAAILLHGSVLYISYLATYLLNGWLKRGILPILVFSGIFVFGYLAIWLVIYTVTKRNTEKLNRMLHQQQTR